ncbi:MAG: glycosyltransferase family 25 protein [Proteobacteria bacterium]|nr:glycosyltransferase family 25 protein [Pseudomonadota bacterium]
MKIFVLNLERAVERRALMQQRLAELGLEAEFLPAIDGARVDRGSLPAGAEQRLSNGELGCYLSHRRSWEIVVERGLALAVVLEDDVVLSPELPRVIAGIAGLDLPYDLVRLSSLGPVRGIPVAGLEDGRRLILPNKNPSGAQGYLVSQAGARRLLARLAVPQRPVDDEFDLYWKHDLCIPVVFPCVVEEDGGLASTIGARMDGHPRKTIGRHLARVIEAKRRKLAVFLLARRFRQAAH